MGQDSGRVLVVDDDTFNRRALCDVLAARGFEATGAANGRDALERISTDCYDIVLLDISMPDLDGFEVLAQLRRWHSRSELPVIMVTGWGQREHVVRALEAGANDYLTKPLDVPVMLARIHTQLSLKRAYDQILALEHDLELRNAQLEAAHKELQAAYADMKADLRSAAAVQQALLPHEPPRAPGLRFAWSFRPCAELAGDTLDAYRLDEHHVAFYLLDVSGHGVRAALLAVTLSRLLAPQPERPSLVRRLRADGRGLEPTPPHVVAEELNRRFQLDLETWQYFTLFYGVLDTRDLRLRYVSAGHPGPFYVPHDGPPVNLRRPVYAIGWVPDPGYTTSELLLRPGDRLVLCSDGIQEARNRDKQQFGPQRVLDCLAACRNADIETTLAQLLRQTDEFAADALDDDVSALAIEVAPSRARTSAATPLPATATCDSATPV